MTLQVMMSTVMLYWDVLKGGGGGEGKFMPFLQKNPCINASVSNPLKPMEKLFWIPWESYRIEKLRLLADFTKSRVPSAGEHSCSASLVAAPCRQYGRHHSSRVTFFKFLCNCTQSYRLQRVLINYFYYAFSVTLISDLYAGKNTAILIE